MNKKYYEQVRKTFQEIGFEIEIVRGKFIDKYFSQPTISLYYKDQPQIRFVGEEVFLKNYLQKKSLTEEELVGSLWVDYFKKLSKHPETKEYREWRAQAKDKRKYLTVIISLFNQQVSDRTLHIHLQPYDDGNVTTCFEDANKQRMLFEKRGSLSQEDKALLLRKMNDCLDDFIQFSSHFPQIRDIFTVSPTHRGYLANSAFSRSAVVSGASWDPTFGYILGINYLYGGELYGMYPAQTKTIPKKWKGVLGYEYVPQLIFQFRNKPFVMVENQVTILQRELRALGYDYLAPYYYSDSTGEELRKSVEPLIAKQKKTKEYLVWEKDQKNWKKRLSDWHDAFCRTRDNDLDFSLKLYDYDTYIMLTIKDDRIDSLDRYDRLKQQRRHEELLKDFAAFLYDGFLNKKKGFGKCLYE